MEEAKAKITEKLVSMGEAKKVVNFRMQDWVFSRQRYWGEPIPMINCPHCGWVPVPDDELPLLLPEVESYEPSKEGESPLSKIEDWVNCKCPHCHADAKRETDTMPGWAGSSWYFMRYCDPHNDKEFASFDALKAWMPVGLYNGGNEHTNRHLLYARFWNKFLYDIGLSPVNEPFMSRISQGIVLGSNGVKMSKSLGNVVDPRDVIKEYGADSLRIWESFMGDYFQDVNWSDEGVRSANKFVGRVVALKDILVEGEQVSKELAYIINTTIKKVTEDIDKVKFNTAIAQLMTCVNEIYKVKKLNNAEYRILLTLLNPFAPHITEELWTQCGYGKDMTNATWPSYDESKLVRAEVEIAIQVNSKIVAKTNIETTSSQQEVLEQAKQDPKVQQLISDKTIVKEIYVPNRIVNIIVK